MIDPHRLVILDVELHHVFDVIKVLLKESAASIQLPQHVMTGMGRRCKLRQHSL